MDALFWKPDWRETPRDEFAVQMADALSGETWVCDGNYSSVRHAVWPRLTHVVWLDLPRPIVLRRVVVRSLRRAITREPLWAGNRERWSLLWSRDGIIWWSWTTWKPNRVKVGDAMRAPEYSHIRFVRLCSSREVKRWLRGIRGFFPPPPVD